MQLKVRQNRPHRTFSKIRRALDSVFESKINADSEAKTEIQRLFWQWNIYLAPDTYNPCKNIWILTLDLEFIYTH